MKQFQVGRTYSTPSRGDSEFIISLTVWKRTAKTITTEGGKTLRIRIWQDVERVKPCGGSDSMALTIGADDENAPLPDWLAIAREALQWATASLGGI